MSAFNLALAERCIRGLRVHLRVLSEWCCQLGVIELMLIPFRDLLVTSSVVFHGGWSIVYLYTLN